MDLYSELMGLQETIEFLETKTEVKLDKERLLKIIEQNNLPIVFEYEGWAIWETYQVNSPLQVELKGYFKHINPATILKAYTGFLEGLEIPEAEIHVLDYYKIRNNNELPEGCKPKVGDLISFANGGRPPLFSSTSPCYVVIKNSNIGILRSELEKFLSKNKLSYEEPQARINDLEAENIKLKKRITELEKQLEQSSQQSDKIPTAEYITDPMKALNAVVNNFWLDYDPKLKNQTKQYTIIEWIKENYPMISDSMALWIDKIVRHPKAK